MDARSLKHVLILSKELNYTRAAQNLNITQSALSRSIKSVESKYNLRLFDRDRGGVHLTDAGKVFSRRAAEILSEINDLDHELSRMARGEKGDVSYGMTPLPAKALLPSVLLDSLNDSSEPRSNVMVRTPTELLSMLLEERIDFFLCAERQISVPAPVKERWLFRFPCSLLVRSGHPLLSSGSSSKNQIYPFVTGVSNNLNTLPQYLKRYCPDEPRLVLDDYSVLSELAQKSDALLFASTFAFSREIEAGVLTEIPSPEGEEKLSSSIMLYSLERRTLSPPARKIIQGLTALFQHSIE